MEQELELKNEANEKKEEKGKKQDIWNWGRVLEWILYQLSNV